jgi:hypothetical protein
MKWVDINLVTPITTVHSPKNTTAVRKDLWNIKLYKSFHSRILFVNKILEVPRLQIDYCFLYIP